MDRPITVTDNTVIAHAWMHDSKQRRFNYDEHVSLIASTLKELSANDEPHMICIVGISGSGKTMLAKLLAETGTNSQYINCLEWDNPIKKDALNHIRLLSDSSKTYLLDSPEFLNDSVWQSVNNHIESLGICICFIQDKRDYQGQFNPVFLTLDRNGLRKE